jgi:nucleotide-binding universal stress UspA family protein
MRDILMATDLSPASGRALSRAVGLAAGSGAGLAVLHVVDDRLPEDLVETVERGAQAAIRSQLSALPAAAGLAVDIRVIRGDPFAAILEEAWRRKADLVVLGNHRKAPLVDLVRGTTVERVLRQGTFPALVVKDAPAGPYRRCLVALDLATGSRRALETALTLMPHGEFFLLHAYEVPFPAFLGGAGTAREVAAQRAVELDRAVEEAIGSLVDGHPGLRERCRLRLVRGEARPALTRAVAELRPDLLAIGGHGRSGIARAVLGSIALEILADPPTDILAAKGW